jgi:hypothetical protein
MTSHRLSPASLELYREFHPGSFCGENTMSGTTLMRTFALCIALALSACATPPQPLTTQSLLESMSARPRSTLASCGVANMALVCQSSAGGRTQSAVEGRCSCADRNEITLGTR